MRKYVRTDPVVTEKRRMNETFAQYIEDLLAEITSLQTQITALEARVEALENP